MWKLDRPINIEDLRFPFYSNGWKKELFEL